MVHSLTRFLGLLLCLGVVTASASTASRKWERLENCRLVASIGNDGDSFHVQHQGRTYVFRLCYVDTPEGSHFHWLETRLREQEDYWKISRNELFKTAEIAADFSRNQLSRGFTVRTNWHDAKGSGAEKRFFALIETPKGDLAELLVANGLARVYGYMPPHPDGKNGPAIMSRLRGLEDLAFHKKLGAWKTSKRRSPPARAPRSNSLPDAVLETR